MDHTTEYLVKTVFQSPFDFFQDFGTYWDEQGWSRIGHQLEDLFRRLQQFLASRESAELKNIIGLMKLDYFMNQKYKPRKPWWEASLDKSGRKEIYEYILNKPEQLGSSFTALALNEKEIHKHTLLEALPFDLETYLAEEQSSINLHSCLPILIRVVRDQRFSLFQNPVASCFNNKDGPKAGSVLFYLSLSRFYFLLPKFHKF